MLLKFPYCKSKKKRWEPRTPETEILLLSVDVICVNVKNRKENGYSLTNRSFSYLILLKLNLNKEYSTTGSLERLV
jgi:hypothetical protein